MAEKKLQRENLLGHATESRNLTIKGLLVFDKDLVANGVRSELLAGGGLTIEVHASEGRKVFLEKVKYDDKADLLTCFFVEKD